MKMRAFNRQSNTPGIVLLALMVAVPLASLLPGPISGNYDVNFAPADDDNVYFYRIQGGHVWLIAETHGADYLGRCAFTNGSWQVPFNPLYQVRYPARPRLYWIELARGNGDGHLRLWRKWQLWKTLPYCGNQCQPYGRCDFCG